MTLSVTAGKEAPNAFETWLLEPFKDGRAFGTRRLEVAFDISLPTARKYALDLEQAGFIERVHPREMRYALTEKGHALFERPPEKIPAIRKAEIAKLAPGQQDQVRRFLEHGKIGKVWAAKYIALVTSQDYANRSEGFRYGPQDALSLLRPFEDGKPLKVREFMAKYPELNRRDAGNKLSTLARKGFLERKGNNNSEAKTYQITPEGLELLERDIPPPRCSPQNTEELLRPFQDGKPLGVDEILSQFPHLNQPYVRDKLASLARSKFLEAIGGKGSRTYKLTPLGFELLEGASHETT